MTSPYRSRSMRFPTAPPKTKLRAAIKSFSLSGKRFRIFRIKTIATTEKRTRKERRKNSALPANIPKAAPLLRMYVKLKKPGHTGTDSFKGKSRLTTNLAARSRTTMVRKSVETNLTLAFKWPLLSPRPSHSGHRGSGDGGLFRRRPHISSNARIFARQPSLRNRRRSRHPKARSCTSPHRRHQ